MDSTLRIQLDIPNLGNMAPVFCELFDSHLRVVRRWPLRGDEVVNVQPGFYLARAHLPSGETVTAQAVVSENEHEEIRLVATPSDHEWLSWQQFLGEVGPSAEIKRAVLPQGLWLQLWARDSGGWEPQPFGGYRSSDPTIVVQELNYSTERLHMLQVGGDNVPWRFICLPPTPQTVQVLLRASRSPSERNGGLAVKVASLDHRAETLSHYLRSGSVEAARLISDEVLGEAEQMLFNKLRNPMGAVIGGYYLLSARAYEQMHNWPNNLANWFEWLADGAIIHAWQLLRTAGTRGRSQARERLLQAAERGLPIFSEGMRLLLDGLELFAEHRKSDQAVAEALTRLRRYASAMDWEQRLTTFYGAGPDEPSLTNTFGPPPPSSYAQFVA